ncbi:MAG: type II toxin-antitoxin system antitoxin SocA domain-containing protein [Acidobacteriota bacterium]
MVNQQAADLVIGLITAIRARGSSVRKTMLLKFLYLADIANYRANGETFTGFDWIFHRFGPWAREYDELLESLQETGQVSIESTDWEDDKAYESIRSEEKRDLHGVFPSLEAQHELSLALDALADKPLGEILDHVYFETEPMEGAERLSRLDFSKVDRGVEFAFTSRSAPS